MSAHFQCVWFEEINQKAELKISCRKCPKYEGRICGVWIPELGLTGYPRGQAQFGGLLALRLLFPHRRKARSDCSCSHYVCCGHGTSEEVQGPPD